MSNYCFSCAVIFVVFIAIVRAVSIIPQVEVNPWVQRSHVRFVDHDPATNNFLFRTGTPSDLFSAIDMPGLKRDFGEEAKKAGLKLPDDFYLIDLCLWTSEYEDIAKEAKWFSDHKDRGEFHWWPMWGVSQEYVDAGCKLNNITHCATNMQPGTMSPEDEKVMALSYPQWANDTADQIGSRMAMVNAWLHTPADKPRVIFGHCTCGCDRTGEFFAAYMLQYQNKSFVEAMTIDESVPKRHIGYSHQVAAQWYCNYLRLNGNITTDDCDKCEPFRCSDS
mmetsp:Transcript_2326/g.5475  ORF Transcript_2326/g.5475 Transcript_2326/m.5475 type:complete len:278 (+) Transcript_2326:43-876(+)